MELDETSIVALAGSLRCQLFSSEVAGGSSYQQKEVLEDVSAQLEFLREVQQTVGNGPVSMMYSY